MEEEPNTITSSGRLVRWFVGGLPLGLIIMGALSFVFYFNKKNAPAPVASDLAGMLRREINTDDFSRYVRILNQEIGVRNEMHRENLEATAAFVDSTLGFDNMGYHVKRQPFDVAGKEVANFVVELTGKVKPKETVLVLAAYDSTGMNLPTEAASTAALFSMAHALTGTTPDRTVRFAAVANAKAKAPGENGCFVLARELAAAGQVVTHVVSLAPLSDVGGLPPEWNKAKLETLEVGAAVQDQAALLARLNALKSEVQKLASVR